MLAFLKIILIKLKIILKKFSNFYNFNLNISFLFIFYKKLKNLLINKLNIHIYKLLTYMLIIFKSFFFYLMIKIKFFNYLYNPVFFNLQIFFKNQLANFIIFNFLFNYFLIYIVNLLIFLFKTLSIYLYFFYECVLVFCKIYFSFVNNFYLDFISEPLKNSFNYTKESLILWFWDIIEAEVERRKVGTVDDFIENSTALLNFIKNFFIKCYFNILWFFIELFKSLEDLKNLKPILVFIILTLYFEIVSIFLFLLKILKLKTRFYIFLNFFKNKINISNIPVYFLYILLLLIFFKIFKVFILFNFFHSKIFNMFFIYFKSYKRFIIWFMFKFDSYFQKFKFERYSILKIFGVKNRFENLYSYSENYFFKNKHWLVRNRFTRWFLRRIRIDRAKYKFAEKIRKRLYISNKRRRLIYCFFKVIIFNFIFFIFDSLFNYYILLKVVEILKDIT